MSSVHELRERYIKRKMGLSETAPSVLNVPYISNVRDEEPNDEPKKPVPWQAPIYSSLQDFNNGIPSLLDSLVSDDDSVEYTSREAILNLRKLFQNVGALYVEKVFNE